MNRRPGDQPYFHISVVAEMLGLHPQTIRNYERMGLIQPSRTEGNMRLFSLIDVERVRRIQSYTSVGVNLAGVEIIMKLLDKLQELQERLGEEMEQNRMEMLEELRRMQEKFEQSQGNDTNAGAQEKNNNRYKIKIEDGSNEQAREESDAAETHTKKRK